MNTIALVTSILYLIIVWQLALKNIRQKLVIVLSTCAVVTHSMLALELMGGNPNNVSVTNMLELIALGMVFIGSWRYILCGDRASYTVVALIASVSLWLPILLPAPSSIANEIELKIHVVFSLSAYIALAFATLYACFLIVQDYLLRKGKHNWGIDMPLLNIERTMIRFAQVGESLLTLSLVSGFIVILSVEEQSFAYKLFFSLFSWLIIGVFLFRHHYQGFRGRSAALLILSGFVSLVTAYFGTSLMILIFT